MLIGRMLLQKIDYHFTSSNARHDMARMVESVSLNAWLFSRLFITLVTLVWCRNASTLNVLPRISAICRAEIMSVTWRSASLVMANLSHSTFGLTGMFV